MILHKPHLCTRMEVWNPKYSTQYGDTAEPVALLHKRKVDFASPVIIVEFTRAKHLAGQRFCIRKQVAQACEVTTNGKAPMYAVPMSQFESWETAAEVHDIALSLFEDYK